MNELKKEKQSLWTGCDQSQQELISYEDNMKIFLDNSILRY